jgi:ATP-binding cassette subfamily B protein
MKSSTSKFPYVWSQLRPFRFAAMGLALILFAQMFLTILIPLPIKFILNHLMKGNSESPHEVIIYSINFGTHSGGDALLLLSFLAFVIGAVFLLFGLWEQIWTGKLSFKIHEIIRRDLIGRVFTRQQSYLESKKKVDLLGRISSDVGNLEVLVTQGMSAILRDIPMIGILLIIMFFIHVKLSLIFALCLPLYYFFSHFFTVLMRKNTRVYRRRTVTFEEETYESINFMAVAKSLRGEEKLKEKLLSRVSDLTQSGIKVLWSNQGMETSTGMAQYIVRGGFIFLGCWAIFRNQIGLGDLFQMLAYMDTLSRHVNNVNKFLSKYPKTAASMERLEELHRDLDLNPEASGTIRLTKERIQNSKSAFTFENVSFEHKEGKRLFDNYSFTFPKNSLVAIVGPSGIGKSSFSRLLNRLNDPVLGRITIADNDIREYELKSLRSIVRILSQETLLISGTVKENLLLAEMQDIPEEKLCSALKAVNALDFVKSLPQGFETKIGEGGHQLSGGQAKRIHLARAFLDSNSMIILFDEPTTGLDTLSSQIVMESIEKLSKEKTVLWVTHRMQEVFFSKNILFFQQSGNPIFSTYRELIESNEFFRALMEQKQESTPKREKEILLRVDNEAEETTEKENIFL